MNAAYCSCQKLPQITLITTRELFFVSTLQVFYVNERQWQDVQVQQALIFYVI